MSKPKTASNIDEIYNLLTDSIIENETVLFTRIPYIILNKNPDKKFINKIISLILAEEKNNFKEKKVIIRDITNYLSKVIHNHLPKSVIFEMQIRYNQNSIKQNTLSPFLYQP